LDSVYQCFSDAKIADLPELLSPGDLLVLNDAATLPASFHATSSTGDPIEIRLLRQAHSSEWSAVLLGEGDWRIPTENRKPPVTVSIGDRLRIADNFEAEIAGISDISNRLVNVRFNRDTAGMWNGIYAYGHPVQYSYLKQALPLYSVQTAYASRPWATEMPSAGYPLSWAILLQLKRRGIVLSWITHAAGISAIGPTELDRLLPMTEAFEIPPETARAIAQARLDGRRIIAVGTTVVRALEGCAAALGGRIVAGRGETDLIIDETYQLSIVNGILTGIHDPSQSHYRLLGSFTGESILSAALAHAATSGYRSHEFGDSCLIL
jgi:S-adenosylmethionine:tRNA ribosyltransferase-isomerase